MNPRVSTFNTNNLLFGQVQRLQVNYAQVTMQNASGLRSDTFKGIAADTQRLLSMDGDTNNLTSQATVIKTAQNRIGAMQNIASTISETLNNVVALFTQVQSGLDLVGGQNTFVAQANVLRDALVSQLNSQTGGNYLFGGSVNDRPPVNISDVDYTPTGTTPSTGYYQGDNVIESVRTTDSQRVEYGITANHPAFENALRALTIFINNPTDVNVIAQAVDINREAVNGVASIQGELLARSNVVANAATLNETTLAYISETVSEVRGVDIAQAAIKMSQYETQLQTSFSALSKLLQLRLTDYLR